MPRREDAPRAAKRRPAPRRPTPRAQRGPGARVLLAVILAAAATALVWELVTPASTANRLLYPVHHAQEIQRSARRHGVDEDLVCAVIKCESGWDEGAVSHVGAVGLMQVMQETAQDLVSMGLVDGDDYPVSDLSDPRVNIEYGCAYLGYLQENLSSREEVIAAYNAGLGAVQGWISNGGSIPEDIEYGETRAYLTRVLDALDAYRRNYPLGVTAG